MAPNNMCALRQVHIRLKPTNLPRQVNICLYQQPMKTKENGRSPAKALCHGFVVLDLVRLGTRSHPSVTKTIKKGAHVTHVRDLQVIRVLCLMWVSLLTAEVSQQVTSSSSTSSSSFSFNQSLPHKADSTMHKEQRP